MPWPWSRPKLAPTVDEVAAEVAPYVETNQKLLPPPLRPGQQRCKHCSHGIEMYRAPGVEMWSTPIGERPPDGVTLGNECPARPVEGFPRTFFRHEPA